MRRMDIKHVLIYNLIFICCQTISATHKVYILHGYGGSLIQMDKIDKGLKHEGYDTDNYTYPSFTESIDSIGHDLYVKIKQENYDSVSFVTHSMGALVVRSMYKYMEPSIHFPYIFRFIMLAPPNKGTEMADFFTNSSFRSFLGPNVVLMRTDSNSYAIKLPIPTPVK